MVNETATGHLKRVLSRFREKTVKISGFGLTATMSKGSTPDYPIGVAQSQITMDLG